MALANTQYAVVAADLILQLQPIGKQTLVNPLCPLPFPQTEDAQLELTILEQQ